MCMLIPIKTTSCTDLSYYPGGRYYLKVGIFCPSTWALVYQQSSVDGINGNLSILGDKIRKGAQLRVQIVTSEESSIYEVDTAWVYGIGNGIVVTAQMVLMIPPFGQLPHEEAYWTRMNINTSSNYLNVVYYFNNYHNLYTNNIAWFIKEPMSECPETHPTKLLELNGHVVEGNYSNVITAITEGYPIQVVENVYALNDRSYPVVNAHYDSENDAIFLFGNWISEYAGPIASDNFDTERVLIRLTPNYQATSFTRHDILNSTEPQSIYNYTFPIILTADFCWEKIYVNDENGGTIFGSYLKLMNRVLNGYSIRVSYECVDKPGVRSVTVDKISDDGGRIITAYVFETTKFPSMTSSNEKWLHEEIDSNGLVKFITFHRSNGTESVETCSAQVTWLAEKKKRQLTWFMSAGSDDNGADSVDSADFYPFPAATVFGQSVLPQILSKIKSSTNSTTHIGSYKLEAFRFLPATTDNPDLMFGVNGHSFNGTKLSVNFFEVQHLLVEHLINVEHGYHEQIFYHQFDIVQWFL